MMEKFFESDAPLVLLKQLGRFPTPTTTEHIILIIIEWLTSLNTTTRFAHKDIAKLLRFHRPI